MSLLPLILMWALTKGGPGAKALEWPTPKHPPPKTARPVKISPPYVRPSGQRKPLPARRSPTPTPRKSTTAPPGPPAPPPALNIAPGPHAETLPPTHVAPTALSTLAVSVLSAQKICNALGARPALKLDGLYGPKTVGAWRAAAINAGLTPTITRLGPKTVDVDHLTYEQLRRRAGVSGAEPPLYIP